MPETKKRINNSTDSNTSIKKRKQVFKSTNPVGEDGIAQCFHKVTTRLYVSLAPCYTNNVIGGIKKQHLDPLLMTYFPQVDGVVLSYLNIQLSDDNLAKDDEDNQVILARVSYDSPFAFMWITVDFLVWSPQVGDVVEGHSYMQTASHIGLLIHDTFNASIKKNSIPPSWRFVPIQADETEEVLQDNKFRSFGHWVDENDVKIEGKLKFTIRAIHSTGKVVSVDGTLSQPDAERDALPVFQERRSSMSKHKKFDDVEPVIEIAEPSEDTEIPTYEAKSSDDEDDEVVANEGSSDEEDSD